MTRAADPPASTRPAAGWFALLAVIVAIGVVVPPAGAALAAVAAVAAHVQQNRTMRTVFAALALALVVVSLLAGAFLLSLGGGESATGG